MSLATAYDGLEPAQLWRHFAALNAIPRPSGREAEAAAYCRSTAEAAGASWQADRRGNTVIRVAAAPGCERLPSLAVQAHLDMVCEQRPGTGHDFTRDPIRPRRVDGWIYATDTTLGADNGIGVAAALALMTTPGLRHGPLELILTVEEEVGLFGAADLDPGLVASRLLVNLDSEDPREVIIGCAGGGSVTLTLPLALEESGAGWSGLDFRVGGLKGGHSGVQIHEPLANAIVLAAEVGGAVAERCGEVRVARAEGGNAHNAIPRDAILSLAVPAGRSADALRAAGERMEAIRARWRQDEPGLALEAAQTEPAPSLPPGESRALLDLLAALPHGVLAMSDRFPGKVETSANLARLEWLPREGVARIGCSLRSFRSSAVSELQQQIVARASTTGAQTTVREGYSGWEPAAVSPLREWTLAAYRRVLGAEPEVQVIHAGLECGVIVSRCPGMDAVSFGPAIRGAHTPEERVEIAGVESTWRVLTTLLAALPPAG